MKEGFFNEPHSMSVGFEDNDFCGGENDLGWAGIEQPDHFLFEVEDEVVILPCNILGRVFMFEIVLVDFHRALHKFLN